MKSLPALQRLFVYGTLADPAVCTGLLGRAPRPAPAKLHGFVRYEVRGEAYPAIVAEPGGLVPGSVYADLTLEELAVLDGYEGDEYARIEVSVETDAGRARAWVYVWIGGTERLGPGA
jgi:gamma-glutamylcyclotransferase (GGCT)/AIG2-like uncharacterized protein YtfP